MKEPRNLGEKIKLIKKLLRKPYHVFYYTERSRAIFRIEDAKGEFLFWEGPYIAASVESGMDYLRHEVEMGAVKTDEKKEEEKK